MRRTLLVVMCLLSASCGGSSGSGSASSFDSGVPGNADSKIKVLASGDTPIPMEELTDALERWERELDDEILTSGLGGVNGVKAEDTNCFYSEDEAGKLDDAVWCGPYAVPENRASIYKGQWARYWIRSYYNMGPEGEPPILHRTSPSPVWSEQGPSEKTYRPDGAQPSTEVLERPPNQTF